MPILSKAMNQEIKKATLHHGGDDDWARNLFKYRGKNWLDLSTGINAHAYPLPALCVAAAQRLPQKSRIIELENAARRYYQVAKKAELVFAPGSQALIQWLPQICTTGKVAILGPTYQEHRNCWQRCGHQIHHHNQLEKALASQPDYLIIVNPDNPTGREYKAETLLAAVQRMRQHQGILIVDEAFCDVTPAISMAAYAGQKNLVIFKSFGKFFGLAGLRLGIALADLNLANRLARAIGPWAVAGPTLDIARMAYDDAHWIKTTKERLSRDRERLAKILSACDLKISGGCDLFLLVEDNKAPDLFHWLGNRGIMTRHFPTAPRHLRIGLPGPEEDWHRLEAALEHYHNRTLS